MRVTVVGTGRILTLHSTTVLNSGGEANIHAVPDLPGPTGSVPMTQVAKVYRQPTPDRAAKLELMVASPPDDPLRGTGHCSLAWPTDLLRDDGGRIVGFLMPQVPDVSPLIDFFNPLQRLTVRPHCNYLYLHRLARNFALVVAAVHDRHYIVGDINESNVLGTDTAMVTLVDNDSFQVVDATHGKVYRCPVGKPEFTSPELQGIPFVSIDREPKHDQFGMAVLIFLLLMEGTHPYAGVFQGQGDPPGIAERIRDGDCPHLDRPTGRIRPAPLAPAFDTLPHDLRRMFRDAFSGGSTPRPSARAWADALAVAEQSLQRCPHNVEHLFAPHVRACPWCARRDRMGGVDPFPAPGAQRPKELQKPEATAATIVTPLRTSLTVPALPPRIAARHPQALPTSNASFGSGPPHVKAAYDVETVGGRWSRFLGGLGTLALILFGVNALKFGEAALLLLVPAAMAFLGAWVALTCRRTAEFNTMRREIVISTRRLFGDASRWRTIPFRCVRGVTVDCGGSPHDEPHLRVIASGLDPLTLKTDDTDLASLNHLGKDLAKTLGVKFFPGARGTKWHLLGNAIEKMTFPITQDPTNEENGQLVIVKYVLAFFVAWLLGILH